MEHARLIRFRRVALFLLLLPVAAAIWWGLDRAESPPDWVQVVAPPRAVAGQPFPMRVQLAPGKAGGYLCVDLHWSTGRYSTRGYLAGGDPKPVGTEGGSFDFPISVPPRENLRFVNGVVYLTPTGNWNDRTRAVFTDPIQVTINGPDSVSESFEPLRMHSVSAASKVFHRPSAFSRALLSLLLLAATVLAWLPKPSCGPNSRWLRTLAVGLALACVWELLGLEGWLGERARALAKAEDVYYRRFGVQRLLSTAVIIATLVVITMVTRVRRGSRLVIAAFVIYVGVSLLSLLSLHALDRLGAISWHGLTLVRAVKLGCAILILMGLGNARAARLPQGTSAPPIA